MKPDVRHVICHHCRARIREQYDRTWRHDGNGSVLCHPGSESSPEATPLTLQLAAASP